MTVYSNSPYPVISESKRFLSSNINNNHITSYDLEYIYDITNYITEENNQMILRIPYFPEKFNIIATYNMRKISEVYSQEKITVVMSNIQPFTTILPTSVIESPNFIILIIFLGSFFFLLVSHLVYSILISCKFSNKKTNFQVES